MNRSQESDGSMERAELAKEINSPNKVPQSQGVDADTRRPTPIDVSNKKSVKKSNGNNFEEDEYGEETSKAPSRSASKMTKQ